MEAHQVESTAEDAETTDKPAAGDEELRFIRSFHDVFLCIGILILTSGIYLVSTQLAQRIWDSLDFIGAEGNIARKGMLVFALINSVNAAFIWALAEFFARIKRRVLPSMLLAFVFVGTISVVGTQVYLVLEPASLEWIIHWDNDGISALVTELGLVFMMSGSLGAFLFYIRTKLPFAMGLLGVGLAGGCVFAILSFIGKEVFQAVFFQVLLISGILLFLLGIYFDARDPKRVTRYSDNGFWLHFFAAPVIFVSAVQLTTGGIFESSKGVSWAVATLAIVFVFALISILINRRALLVSGLLSAGIAIGILVAQTDLDVEWMAAVTLLFLGSAMLLLGAGWYPLRRYLVARFPKSGLIARIIPPMTIEE